MFKFTHLHTHSHYSLLDGLAKIDDLVNKTKELGMDSLALTDHGVLYGAVEFYKKAAGAGVKPILGVEAYIAPKSRHSRDPGERYFHLILLAENNAGWKNLIKIVSKAHLEGFYYKPRADKELLREHREGLIALSACLSGEVNRSLLYGKYDEAKKIALEYEEIFGKGNFFLEIGDHPHIPEVVKIKPEIIKLSRETMIPLAATQDSHYLNRDDAEYHDILLAVQTGNKTSDDDRLTLKADDFSMTSPKQMAEKFKDLPEAIENTAKIAERCNVTLELGKALLPDFPKPEGKTANEYLEEIVRQKLGNRYSKEEQTKELKDRLEFELGVIEKTGFADYFLIVQDFVNWAKLHGIAVGPGRGSAAGSIVSYILGITDIDPLKYGLLFERFLNPERIQMPDIDIDFADTRRDEVLAYLRQKYGEDRVAQIITFGTMAARAAVRDAGRAMGLAYAFCDKIAKLIPFNFKLKDAIKNVPELGELYEKNEDAKKVLRAAEHLEGVARHASVHACGTVISKEPLTEYVPLQFAPQDKENIITQFEMHSVEDLGLLKMDLLGLKNLTIIEETVRLIKETRGESVDIEKIPLHDEKTFELLRRGDTTGVFQLEGGGMRRYLKDLKPTEFEDIIVMISLYRPGTLDAGMVPKYIARKNGKEKVAYLHPKLEPALKKTYGIMVYQEQLMEVARALAGFTFSEADTLRKAVGKKIKSLLNEQKEKMINGMIKNGIPDKLAEEIWSWFEPFARYGFNKSHATAYAMIAYRTAYLKAYYPEEFMAGLLNAEVSDIERIAVLIQEAKQSGLEILPPDINKSFTNFTPEVEHNNTNQEAKSAPSSVAVAPLLRRTGIAPSERRRSSAIRFGLLAIKNVGLEITKNIIEERLRGGPFKNFEDLITRVQHKDLNKKSLESLAKCGALDSLGTERNQALENMNDILRFVNSVRKDIPEPRRGESLFGIETMSKTSLKLKPARPATKEEKLNWEKELLGFFLSDHPLKSYEDKIKAAQAKSVSELRAMKTPQLVKAAGLISRVQKIITKTGQPMLFVKIEDFSSQKPIEIVVFNSVLVKTEFVWQENNVVVLSGKLSFKDDEPKILCENAMRLEA